MLSGACPQYKRYNVMQDTSYPTAATNAKVTIRLLVANSPEYLVSTEMDVIFVDFSKEKSPGIIQPLTTYNGIKIYWKITEVLKCEYVKVQNSKLKGVISKATLNKMRVWVSDETPMHLWPTLCPKTETNLTSISCQQIRLQAQNGEERETSSFLNFCILLLTKGTK